MNRQEFIDQIIYQAEIHNFSLLQLQLQLQLIQVFAAYLLLNVIFGVCLLDKLQNMKTSSRALGTCDCIFNNTKWR